MKKSFLGIAVVVLLGAGGTAAGYRFINYKGDRSGAPVEVTIQQGASGAVIARQLERHRVIESALAFRLYLKTNHVNTALRAGDYVLREHMAFDQLAEALKTGPAKAFVKLTIPEGFNLHQTAAQVEKQTHISAEEFLAAAVPSTIRPAVMPADVNTLEGFLYPATYFVEEDETAATLVTRLVQESEKQISESQMDRSSLLGRTPYEIMVIASMIEEETKVPSERPLVSAVIHNRLTKMIPLGIDATIQYIVNKYQGQPLTKSDLEIDSPFNTRRFQGLPPTPISSPRQLSIEAALDPAKVDFIFYVLKDCRNHFFTADSQEFGRAKAAQPRDC
ncbi:MAG: endolytic transglycosylase MltG [Actinomycetota bacterium]